MTIYQRLIYVTACLEFKCLHNYALSFSSHNLNYISEYHQYNTCSAESYNLVTPGLDTSLYTHSFAYFGPKIWNQLPTTVLSSYNIHLFKKALTKHDPSFNWLRPFFIIDWFMDPPTLLFGKIKTIKTVH